MSSPDPQSSSAPSRAQSPSSTILTPGAKVRALLAQFDSDSDGVKDKSTNTRAKPSSPIRTTRSPIESKPDDDSDGEDDDLPIRPRGRVAGRMRENEHGSEQQDSTAHDEPSAAYQRIKRQFLQRHLSNKVEAEKAIAHADAMLTASGESLLKRKSSAAIVLTPGSARSRSVSPLFFPSPSPSKRARISRSPSHIADGSFSDTDSDDGHVKKPNPRFMALVEKQRRKRLEQEAAEAKKKADKMLRTGADNRRQRGSSPADLSEEESESDENGAGRKLTQHARPTRKASKKALEEMHRETQRMSRNMQLAHQAQTKKKITKESLLAKFNFALPVATKEVASSTTSSSAPNSDGELDNARATPPTSPLGGAEEERITEAPPSLSKTIAEPVPAAFVGEADVSILALHDSRRPQQPVIDKGKAKAVEAIENIERPLVEVQNKRKRRQLRLPLSRDAIGSYHAELSDDDLEILPAVPGVKKLAVFDKLPTKKAREAPSHLILRSLAHITSPGKQGNGKRPTMTAPQMAAALRKQARLQAAQERSEKIAELKAKGVYVQSAEEREKEQQEVEDLVEKARQEAAEIQKREERRAKKDGTFQDDGLDDDDDDDEYDGRSYGEEADQISGSDEEQDDDAENSGGDPEGDGEEGNEEGMLDDEASEIGSEDGEELISNVDEAEVHRQTFPEEDTATAVPVQAGRKRRMRRTLADSDEEEEEEEATQLTRGQHADDVIMMTPTPQRHDIADEGSPRSLPRATTKTPQSIIRSARKVIPGLPLSDDMPIGLTQAFAATMADSQSQRSTEVQEQDSLEMIRDLPEPEFPVSLERLNSVDMVTDSQPASQTQPLGLKLSFTQSQDPSQIVEQSPLRVSATQYSEVPEPTQDAGYILSPFQEKRFDTPALPHSTIDTVILPKDDSPLVQRRGKLHRRLGMTAATESDEEELLVGGRQKTSAFDIIRQGARQKQRQEAFDKSRSEAKGHFDEAAEESEDEYAGLGGASDDEEGQENEEDRKMINDANNEKVNERELAALYADKERAEDSAAVSKLLEDITTGRLRRKRGAGGFDDLDLSDEESVDARRRETKRREFAKMRRELLLKSDDRIGKIADDPRKLAFLKAIEDRDDENDMDLDLEYHDESVEASSQSQMQRAASNEERTADASLEVGVAESNKLETSEKRALQPSRAADLNRKPTATYPRRKSASGRRPHTLAEIRESVSFLIEDPVDTRTPSASDSESDTEAHQDLDQAAADALMDELDRDNEEDEDEDMDDFIVQDEEPIGDRSIFKKPAIPASRAPFSQRRTQTRGPVVDRLSLLRQSSSSSSGSVSNGGKMAFMASSSAGTSFKVPSLLRRATTNSSFSNSDIHVSATGVTTSTERGAAGSDREMIRKTSGGQKSSVGYYKTSRAQQREEAMRNRLEEKKGTKGGVRKRVGGGLLGSLVTRNAWE